MIAGQVIDMYDFGGALQLVLWNSVENKKRTIELINVIDKIEIGDIIQVHGVGGYATVLASDENVDEIVAIIDRPVRAESVIVEMPMDASVQAQYL